MVEILRSTSRRSSARHPTRSPTGGDPPPDFRKKAGFGVADRNEHRNRLEITSPFAEPALGATWFGTPNPCRWSRPNRTGSEYRTTWHPAPLRNREVIPGLFHNKTRRAERRSFGRHWVRFFGDAPPGIGFVFAPRDSRQIGFVFPGPWWTLREAQGDLADWGQSLAWGGRPFYTGRSDAAQVFPPSTRPEST
jgi:hypothetical protein